MKLDIRIEAREFADTPAGGNVVANRNGSVVLVSSQGDPHVVDMVQALYEISCTPIVVDSNAFPIDASLSLSLGDYSNEVLGRIELPRGKFVDLDNVKSVWWRRPGHYFGIPQDFSLQQREFVKEEWTQAFYGAWTLPDAYWINNPESVRPASWKVEQLQRAVQMGFEIPATIVTNDPQAVREFYDRCAGKMIYKVLSDTGLGGIAAAEKDPSFAAEARQTLTTIIGPDELLSIDSVRMAPGIFQKYIEKRVELRVTVIGDEVFVAEIYSQENAGTMVDWRAWQDGGLEIQYRVGSLPPDIEARCLQYVRSYGLNFSTMDIVLTPDGRYVFLENNANGNFMWVEKLLPELKMTAALAGCLVRGANS